METASKFDKYVWSPLGWSVVTSFRLVAKLTGYEAGQELEAPVPLRPDRRGHPSLTEDRRDTARRELLNARAEALAVSPDRVYESARKRQAIVDTVTQDEVVPRLFDT